MTHSKFSELPAVDVLDGTAIVPIVQDGVTSTATVDQVVSKAKSIPTTPG